MLGRTQAQSRQNPSSLRHEEECSVESLEEEAFIFPVIGVTPPSLTQSFLMTPARRAGEGQGRTTMMLMLTTALRVHSLSGEIEGRRVRTVPERQQMSVTVRRRGQFHLLVKAPARLVPEWQKQRTWRADMHTDPPKSCLVTPVREFTGGVLTQQNLGQGLQQQLSEGQELKGHRGQEGPCRHPSTAVVLRGRLCRQPLDR